MVVDRRASGEWALPGTFLHEGERLADAVVRVLRDKCGIEGVTPHQLRVSDDPTRDPRGWVLSVAHAVVVPHDRVSELPDDVSIRPLHDAHLDPASSSLADLAFDHQEIVTEAVDELRTLYQDNPTRWGCCRNRSPCSSSASCTRQSLANPSRRTPSGDGWNRTSSQPRKLRREPSGGRHASSEGGDRLRKMYQVDGRIWSPQRT